MTDGGWYKCPDSMTGIIFGVYSTTSLLHFMELMAYSQNAIQMGEGLVVSFLGTNNPTYPASNVIQNIVYLIHSTAGR